MWAGSIKSWVGGQSPHCGAPEEACPHSCGLPWLLSAGADSGGTCTVAAQDRASPAHGGTLARVQPASPLVCLERTAAPEAAFATGGCSTATEDHQATRNHTPARRPLLEAAPERWRGARKRRVLPTPGREAGEADQPRSLPRGGSLKGPCALPPSGELQRRFPWALAPSVTMGLRKFVYFNCIVRLQAASRYIWESRLRKAASSLLAKGC